MKLYILSFLNGGFICARATEESRNANQREYRMPRKAFGVAPWRPTVIYGRRPKP